MNRVYTTLFDSNYLARGLVMLESLLQCSKSHFSPPEIHILAMDDNCYRLLQKLMRINHNYEVYEAGEDFKAVRGDRTHQEWCWQLASVFTRHVADWMNDGRQLTYLDADLMFFRDPELIFDDIADYPIAIVPHRFNEHDAPKFLPNGKYNVSWVTFSGELGRKCLSRWSQQCIDWCYYRNEDGKFGDQKYLDEWETLYKGDVKVLSNPDIGVAPWNLHTLQHGTVHPIFYHYSGFKENMGGGYTLAGPHWREVSLYKTSIYRPYIIAYERAKRLIKTL